MKEAFRDADIVYPKSWAPFKAMEERTKLYQKGDKAGIDALEKKLLAQNAEHKNWACTEEMMQLTKDGKALYLHCLPADISGLSCPEGEVDNPCSTATSFLCTSRPPTSPTSSPR